MSVIIATYERSRYLGEAIASALAQTQPVEVIVVDDGSTDDTPAVIAAYGARVRALRQQNRGPAAARNLALSAASGEYVAFLDSDDRFLPEKVARQATALDAHPECGLVSAGWRFIDANGHEFGRPVFVRTEGDLQAALLLGNPVHLVAVMVRRALVEEAGGFEESLRFNEDWDLFLRLSAAGARWTSVDAPLWEYRVHPGQTVLQTSRMLDDRLRVLARAFAEPALPAALRGLEVEAVQNVHLAGAAEYHRAGAQEEAAHAFRTAVLVRPAFLTEPRGLLRFCRLLLPPGFQRQAETVRRWPELSMALRDAVAGVLADGSLDRRVAGLRWRTWWAMQRVRVRMMRKGLTQAIRRGPRS